jgi:hypothetical protein
VPFVLGEWSKKDGSFHTFYCTTLPTTFGGNALGYPFKNQEVNSPVENLNATYLMQKLQRKRKGRSIMSALFWNG